SPGIRQRGQLLGADLRRAAAESAVGRAQTSRDLDGGHAASLSRPALGPGPQRSRPAVTTPTTPRPRPAYVMGGAFTTFFCRRSAIHHKQARAGYVPAATLRSAVTPATDGGYQTSPRTPSAPGTSLAGRAFGPT